MSIINYGVYIEEIPSGPRPISGVSTSDTAFVDYFPTGPLDEATRITSFEEFRVIFGGIDPRSEASYCIQQFFLNGGSVAWVVRVVATNEPPSSEWTSTEGADAILGRSGDNKGIYALRNVPSGFNILCLPAAAGLSADKLKSVYDEAAEFCNESRAFLIVDIPPGMNKPEQVVDWLSLVSNPNTITRVENAAVYFPRLTIAAPLMPSREIGASGTIAGLYARTDRQRGVWKAAAGVDANLRGVNLITNLSDGENGMVNRLGINALRKFSTGIVCWGGRTLLGADELASEWKYIPVRRTALFLEESIYQGTQWVVFEPNDEPLWAQIRLNVGAFLHNLFRLGAFQGVSPNDAYFVKCDRETTTPDDIERGTVNIMIGFAPLKRAEFVIIKIQQLTQSPE